MKPNWVENVPFIRNYLKWNIQNWTSRLPLWITIIDQRNLPSFLVVKEHLLSWLKAEAGFYSISALPGLAISKTRVCWDVDKSSCSTRLEQTQKNDFEPCPIRGDFSVGNFLLQKNGSDSGIMLILGILKNLSDFGRENFHNLCQKFLINPRYDELKIDMERECKSDYPTEDHPSVN